MNPLVVNAIVLFAAYKFLQTVGLVSDQNDAKAKKFYDSPALNPNSFKDWLSKYTPFQGAVLLRAYRLMQPETGTQDKFSIVDSLNPLKALTSLTDIVTQTKSDARVSVYEYAANRIYYSKGYLLDDEKGAISVLKMFRSQAEISYLSYVYQKKYGKTLSEHFQTFFSNSDASKAYEYVSKLPKLTYPPTSELNETLRKQLFPKSK